MEIEVALFWRGTPIILESLALQFDSQLREDFLGDLSFVLGL